MSQKIYIYKVLTKESRKDGRPNKYNDVYHPKAVFEIMSLGATKTHCAKILAITRETFYVWMREYSEFSDAVRRGIDKFAVSEAEVALSKRVKGYVYREKTFEIPPIPTVIASSKPKKEETISILKAYIDAQEPVLTKIVEKQVAPDVAAIKYYCSEL